MHQEFGERLGHQVHLLQFAEVALDVLDHLRRLALLVEHRRAFGLADQVTRLVDADLVAVGVCRLGQRKRITPDDRGDIAGIPSPLFVDKQVLSGIEPEQSDRPEHVLALVFQKHQRIGRGGPDEFVRSDIGEVETGCEMKVIADLDLGLGMTVLIDGNDLLIHGYTTNAI